MLLPLLASLLAPLGVLAAAANPQAELVQLAAASPNGVINLDAHTFDLITSPKRNWSATVHFTAMDKRRRCNPCKEFDPSWNQVSKAWTKVPHAERDSHFFGTLDFDNAPTVFQKLGMTSAPVVYVYPAVQGPRGGGKVSHHKYDFSYGFDPAPLAEELSKHTPVPIPYKAPIDWAKWGTGAFVVLSLLASIKFVGPVLQSRWTWALACVGISLVMTSGFMFVRIRGMPFAAPDGNWIAQGYQNQYGQETQVVAMIYGLLAASFLMLTVVTPLQSSPGRQRAQVYLWTAVNLIVFSILISLFRVKNRSYPFKLFI